MGIVKKDATKSITDLPGDNKYFFAFAAILLARPRVRAVERPHGQDKESHSPLHLLCSSRTSTADLPVDIRAL
jgi:hypothetical protein